MDYSTEYRALGDDELQAEKQRLLETEGSEETTARATALAEVLDERKASYDARARLQSAVGAPEKQDEERGIVTAPQRLQVDEDSRATVATRLLRSGQFDSFKSNGYAGKAAVDVSLRDLGIGDLMQRADLVSTDIGLDARPDHKAGFSPNVGDRGVTLSIIPRLGTSANAISYTRETTADPTRSAAAVAEGAAKPEAAFAFTVVTKPVEVIAAYKGITRQTLEDESGFQSFITERLAGAVRSELNNEVLNGTDVSPSLDGLIGNATASTFSSDAYASVQKGLTAVRTAGFAPNAIIVNPADFDAMVTTATGGTFFGAANPFNGYPTTLWGVPVGIDPDQPAGYALIMDTSQVALNIRNEVRVMVADQHADLFLKNTLVVLAELRAQVSVYAPAAVVQQDIVTP